MQHQTVTLSEASNLIAVCGDTNTFLVQGEPGVGKSAMLKYVAERMNMKPVYIDCTMLDVGDLQMPKVTDVVEMLPNIMFVSDEPLLIMLDEIGKVPKLLKDALLPLLYERRVGNHKLYEGSAVFATTNMASDGVGDMLMAHEKNRVTMLTVRKPDADQWIEWASNNGVSPEVMAWVKEYPHALTSYMDSEDDDNPYIFNPRKQQTSFVSPRSLELASNMVKKRDRLTDNELMSGLTGTIGGSAAADMQAFISVADALPSFNEIVANPTGIAVPDSPIATVIMALGAVMRVDSETIEQWMEYMTRLPLEVQVLFASNAMRHNTAKKVMPRSAGFRDWAMANSWSV